MLAEEFKFIKPGEVRTRMAPSPTGPLHVGTARTTLFNYLFARKNEGSFILRIEDTDFERSSVEFEKDIITNLSWLGFEWDEFYRQSQRLDIYAQYLKKLLKENKAYYCFCSQEELEAQKQYQMSQGIAPHYTGKCASLSKETIKKYLNQKKAKVIRFRVLSKKIVFKDLIRGKLEFDAGLMGDIVIAKNENTPLYNFAAAIDDFEMKISHVIRGEDHLSNTPKQILIQEALGFSQPFYAHLPLILGPDRTKLSKRHGATSISDFKKQGYLPESLINFMAFLGWNPGDEREIYSISSLVKDFSLEKIQKSGAVFNIKKLDFLNGFYLRQRSSEKLTELCLPYLLESGLIKKDEVNEKSLVKIISIYQERLKKLSEIVELTDFFFKEKLIFDKDLLRWKTMSDKEIKESLVKVEKALSKIKKEDWRKENLANVLTAEAEKISFSQEEIKDRGKLLWPLRVALTGKQASAGPFEIAEILGKEETLERIKKAKNLF